MNSRGICALVQFFFVVVYGEKIRISNDLNDVDYIYFPSNGQKPLVFKLDIDPKSLLNHGFDPKQDTKIIAHGWYVSGFIYAQEFANAYAKMGQVNVIGIDWSKLATIDNYLQAAINSNRVGVHVGDNFVIKILFNQLGQVPEQIHANGHSLGAHLVGRLGRRVANKFGRKIARLTGLDPAKPYFDLMGIENRIQSTDADLVDIIHTNAGYLHEGAVAFRDPLGQADFYPNGGSHQAGCTDLVCFWETCLGFGLIDFFLGKRHKKFMKIAWTKSVFFCRSLQSHKSS